MKICVLEHPRKASVKRFNDIANTPLWSCLMGGYAAASFETAGYDTTFLDQSGPGCTFEGVLEKLECLSPDLLAVNAVYFWEHTSILFRFLSTLRERGFSGHLTLFGFFPTLVYREILNRYPAVDSIAVGEFEHTLAALARAMDKGKDPASIPGLAVVSGSGRVRYANRPPVKNPDEFAFPKRSSLSGTVTILASRGCYNHCSFCPVPPFYNQGALWRGRSPGNIVREIERLTDQGVREFYFADPNFIGPGKRGKKRVIDLMKQIRHLNIGFGMETRPQDLDDDIMTHLTASGFNSLLMGVESGSDRILGGINKRSDPAGAGRAIELCRKFGIEPEIGFLMFVPDSRVEDLKHNFEFLMKHSLLDRLDRTANLLCHCQIVLAGTSGYRYFDAQERLEKTGIFGFEADVRFLDPKVKYISDLVVFACHTVLRQMSEKRSPIYWDAPDTPVFSKVNQYLVNLFSSLVNTPVDRAGERRTPESMDHRKKAVLQDINRLLSVETTAA